LHLSVPSLDAFIARSRRTTHYLPLLLAILRRFLTVAVVSATVTAALHAQTPAVFPGSTNVSSPSTPLSVTLTITQSATASAPQVFTQGLGNADFAIATGGTCTAGTAYTAGQQCTVNAIFQPKFPGQRAGVAVLKAVDGTVMASTLLSGLAKGSLAVLQGGRIDTIAGNGAWIYNVDGVPATSASIFLPTGIAVDAAGNTFLSDSANNRIRRIDAQTGNISTVAGNGSPGYAGDGGLATQAMISAPAGLVLDGAGTIYFVDSGNHAVRRVDAFSGIITTIAGTGVQGYTGDAGPATAARLSLPQGLVFDSARNLYIADTGNNAVREVDALSGIIRTIAGTGVGGFSGDNILATAATLNSPWSLAFSVDGLLYIADLNNNRVRKINAFGIISTVAGTGVAGFSGDGGLAATALLDAPAALAFDPAGDLYIADSGNNRVRKINAATSLINTITGTGSEAFYGDGGTATFASFYGPYALFFDQAGNLLVADMFHNRVRRISGTTLALLYNTIRVGKISPPALEFIENDGNAPLNLTTPVLNNTALDIATTTCASTPLATTSFCTLGVEFAPTTVGSVISGTMNQPSDAGNSAVVISVYGQVLTVEPTTVTLTSSANPSLLNALVTFTANVSSADPTRSGPVRFFDGNTVLCLGVNLDVNGNATCTVSTLTLGQHTIVAHYLGDANNAAGNSGDFIQTVIQNPTLTLAATPNPAVVTSTVTLTLTASAAIGTPTGTVTFYDGATTIGTATLNTAGTATFTTAQLNVATHILSAKYSGDPADASGTSNTVSEVISKSPTVTLLASSQSTAPVGTAVTFTANITSSNGPTPTGTVQFSDAATLLGTGTLDSNGVANFTTNTLAPGVHNIVATYVGDASNTSSASTAFVETIQQLPTTTVLASDANPANAGVTVHLTATVSIPAGSTPAGPLTGQVTFTDGSVDLGTALVSASGVATLPINTLSVGSHTIVATYSASTNYAGSVSTTLIQVIQQTATTITLTGSANSLSGKTLTLSATITSASGIPAGTVTFLDNGISIGQGTLSAQGIATLSTSALTVGSHPLTTVYAGSTSYSTSTSAPLLESIALATTTLTLNGPANPIDAGTPATFTVTLTGNGVAPTGQLILTDGATVIGAQAVTSIGTFTFTTSTLSITTHQLTAAYAGDANNASATSNIFTATVRQAPTATTLQASANPQILNQPVTLTAAVTSTSPNLSGSVTFFDGATAIGSGVLANGTASFTTATLTAGSHTLTATFTGDTNHATSTSLSIAEQIVQNSAIALASSANPAPSGAMVVFTARVSGPTSTMPTGSITFTDSGTTLGSVTVDATGAASLSSSTLAVGTHTVTAGYTGDPNFAAVTSVPLLQTIQNSSTQIALTASANPSTYATPLTFTAVITTNGGIATGTVIFTDGPSTIGTAPLNNSGIAALTLSTLIPGAHNIIANYAGDGKASTSVSTPLPVSVQQTSRVTLASSANPSPTLSPITFTATVTNTGITTPTGTIAFTDGSTQLGLATLDPTGRASITVPALSASTHSIVATYAGDIANFTSISAPTAQTVTLRGTATTVTGTASNPTDPTQQTLIAVVRWTGPTAPTGTITFRNGTTVIGSVAIDPTGVATINIFIQQGTTTITATYNGDAAYASSDSPTTSITSSPATQFTLAIAPPNMTLVTKNHGVTTITITSVKGFTDTMQFGCLGLPFAATCTFSSPQIKLDPTATATVTLTVDTGNPLGAGAQTSSLRSTSFSTLMCFIPTALFSGILLWRKRRSMPLLTALALLFAIAATLGSTGCAGLEQAGTPPGAYTFQVTAHGQGTGASASQTMTLTVTQ
jgi:sugar lactone lactonase YvrE